MKTCVMSLIKRNSTTHCWNHKPLTGYEVTAIMVKGDRHTTYKIASNNYQINSRRCCSEERGVSTQSKRACTQHTTERTPHGSGYHITCDRICIFNAVTIQILLWKQSSSYSSGCTLSAIWVSAPSSMITNWYFTSTTAGLRLMNTYGLT